jgi:hypothetical protein
MFGGVSGKSRPIYEINLNGVRCRDYVYRIVAMYAIGELFGQGPLFDLREVHHIDDDVNNYKPSNLVIAKNRRQHKQLDLYTRIERIEGKPVTIKLREAVYVSDIIRNDNFDIEIALVWWVEQVR